MPLMRLRYGCRHFVRRVSDMTLTIAMTVYVVYYYDNGSLSYAELWSVNQVGLSSLRPQH